MIYIAQLIRQLLEHNVFNEIDHVKRRNEEKYKKRASIILCSMNLIYELRQHVLYKRKVGAFCFAIRIFTKGEETAIIDW